MRRILKSDRIRLRPPGKADIPFIVKWEINPAILKWTQNSDPPYKEEKMKKEIIKYFKDFLKKKPKNHKLFIIEMVSGNLRQPIGYCGLSEINEVDQDAMFHITIGELNCQGNGYGPESAKLVLDYAFSDLGLYRITSYTAEYNKPSIKFHKKAGFKLECRIKAKIYRNFRHWDRIIFRILRPEWEKNNKGR